MKQADCFREKDGDYKLLLKWRTKKRGGRGLGKRGEDHMSPPPLFLPLLAFHFDVFYEHVCA